MIEVLYDEDDFPNEDWFKIMKEKQLIDNWLNR